MTDNTITADIIKLRKKPKTGAQRAKAYRLRKKAQGVASTPPVEITPPLAETAPVRPEHAMAPFLLKGAAFALAAVGITMNGWFARSLGSSDVAGWLFLLVGVAADACALALPSCASGQWSARRRGAALTGWAVWLATFAFALTAGIGFASVNISDVTTARASRVTPAVTEAQNALNDAVTSRNRECAGGVGKFCREREATVTERRHALDEAMRHVEEAADPQTEAATKMVTWLTHGIVTPGPDDFAMLRLVLLALLPQLGGILLMVARPKS